jgi:hypothetical protein
MTATSKPRYRVPSVSVDAEVDLDEFEIEDIVEYLRHHGYTINGNAVAAGPVPEATDQIDTADLEHIYTLAVCGQIEFAKQEALQVVGKAIGRPLQ